MDYFGALKDLKKVSSLLPVQMHTELIDLINLLGRR